MSESDQSQGGSDRPETEPMPKHAIGAGGRPLPQHLSADNADLDAVDSASADSFPASDPVSSPSIVGATVPRDPSDEER